MPVTKKGPLGDVLGDGREKAKNGDYGDGGISLMDLYGSVPAGNLFPALCETRK
jgi:hypothetical protein